MDTARITIDEHAFEVWLARDHEEQQYGLMRVSQEELAPLPDGTRRGMLFIFPVERVQSFWMFNTIIPLDIAFIRGDGTIAKIYTMAPLETRQYSSIEPVPWVLEVPAGTFAALEIGEGDRVEIPDAVFKRVP
jgi:uncharacterized membrane protein (UPF0127 family)